MDWKELGKKIVSAGAPILGGALLGPAGAAAGALLASELGTEPTPEAVDAVVAGASPEVRLQLIDVQNKHIQTLRQLDIDELKVVTADIQNARHEHKDHWMPSTLTIILAAMVTLDSLLLFYAAVPEANKEVVYFLTGQLVTAFLTAVAYWLGTSRGSADKQRLIERRL